MSLLDRLLRTPPAAVRAGLWLLLAAGGIGLGFNVSYRALDSREQRSDFIVFHAAARAMIEGGDVYSVKHPRGWEIYYPPGMPAVLAPLGLLPLGAAVVVWYAIGYAALVWACVRLARVCSDLSGRPMGLIVALLTLANFGPILSGLQRGQISALLLALMVEAFYQYRRGAPAWAGLWIGVATGLKVYPVLLLIPLIMRREWRGLVVFAVVLAILWAGLPAAIMGPAAGWDTTQRYLHAILLPLLTDSSVATQQAFADINYFGRSNQSLFAFLGRWLCRGSLAPSEAFAGSLADLPPATVRQLSQVASALILLWMAWLARRCDGRDTRREAVLWSLPMLAANFVSTIAWHHYYTVLVVPYALAGVIVVRREPRWWAVAVASWLALLSNWAYFADSAELTGSYTLRQAGLLMVGSAVLWLALARSIAGRSFTGNAARSRS